MTGPGASAQPALWDGVLEHAELSVREQDAAEFIAAFAEHKQLLTEASGSLGALLLSSSAQAGGYLLLVGWRRAEDRSVFRASPAYQQWQACLHRFFADPPEVEHFTLVAQAVPTIGG
jgi:heme-degrading monooxygenase HmoA